MIEEEGAYIRELRPDRYGGSDTQRMIQIPGRLGWFVNEKVWRKLK